MRRMMAREDRIRWVKSLKDGDTVCDCHYRHLKIVKIVDEVDYRLSYRLYFLPMFLIDILESLMRNLGLGKVLLDRELILEDGSRRSASFCCDPVDNHNATDHPEGLMGHSH